jgi:hypothetical protein
VKRALKSDHSADDEGACHSADDYEIIVAHKCILSTCEALPLSIADAPYASS